MELPNGVTPHRKYKEGEEVTADVLNVDPGERKMALTTKGRQEGSKPKPDDGDGGSQQTSSRSSSQDDGFGGTLGDMIGDDLTGD
jgi:ribosomal protein S1